MSTAGARVLEFGVSVDRDGISRSALGGAPIPREDEWSAEHLVLAGLVRCTLASEVESHLEIELEPTPAPDAVRELIERAERGCFVGNSLTAEPRYRWTVNGAEIE